MATRGIIGAFSRNVSPDVVPSDTLMEWYDNIHIPDVIATSGIKTALRFSALDPGSKYPWLVVYPVADIGFAQTQEFADIPKGGHKEIGGRMFTDLAELDLRICERLQVCEGPNPRSGRAPFLVAESIQLGEGMDSVFEQWYKKEYLDTLRHLPGFRRASVYKLVISLKEGSPRHLAFYEFDNRDIPRQEIAKARETGAAKKCLQNAMVDDSAYELVKEAGNLEEML